MMLGAPLPSVTLEDRGWVNKKEALFREDTYTDFIQCSVAWDEQRKPYSCLNTSLFSLTENAQKLWDVTACKLERPL